MLLRVCYFLASFSHALLAYHLIQASEAGDQDNPKMTIKATKFTPEVMLAAPRRSAGVPNPSGTKALFGVSCGELARGVANVL
jgi:hypothetical protein